MPQALTRRELHAARKRQRKAEQITKHSRFAVTALALGSIFAVTAISVVTVSATTPQQTEAFALPAPELTGMGMQGAADNTASAEEVAVKAAAELLTDTQVLVTDSPKLEAARTELAQMIAQFDAGNQPDSSADAGDLDGRGKAASRDSARTALTDGADALAAPEDTGAPDNSAAQDTDAPADKQADAPATPTTEQPTEQVTETADHGDSVAPLAMDVPAPADALGDNPAPVAGSTPDVDAAPADAPADATAPVDDAKPAGEVTVTVAELEAATLALQELFAEETGVSVTTVAEQKAAVMQEAWLSALAVGDSTGHYSNGRIPTSAMTSLSFAPGHYVRKDAAIMLELLNTDFKARFGYSIGMTDSYRSYGLQVSTKRAKGYLAATPGTSNHGWGLALDLKGNVAKWGTAERNWLAIHGPEYGWHSPSWAQRGRGKEEPWHWEFAGASISDVGSKLR